MSKISLNSLAELVGELNGSDMLEGETMTLVPFRLITDGSNVSITFLEHCIWDNEDNRGDDDRDVEDVKEYIKGEMESFLGPIKQINLNKLLKENTLKKKAMAVLAEIAEEAEEERERTKGINDGLRK